MQDSARNQGPAGAEPSRLAELLACERELADLMRATREDARRRVEEARSAATRMEAELEASLTDEAQRVRSEIGSESHVHVRDILARAAKEAARFERLSDQEVERLAESAFQRLLGREDAP